MPSELDKCLDALCAGDTLVVWKLGRLGRSLSHLLGILETLKVRGIAFRSLTERIDTNTAAGTMLYAILGAVAQFERDITTGRSNASLEAKKVRAEPLGRRRVLTSAQVAKACEMVDGGESPAHVARIQRVSRPTLCRALARADAEPSEPRNCSITRRSKIEPKNTAVRFSHRVRHASPYRSSTTYNKYTGIVAKAQ